MILNRKFKEIAYWRQKKLFVGIAVQKLFNIIMNVIKENEQDAQFVV